MESDVRVKRVFILYALAVFIILFENSFEEYWSTIIMMANVAYLRKNPAKKVY